MRYVLANPFYPTNNSYTTATPESLCGISGVGSTEGCNLFSPGNADRRAADVRAVSRPAPTPTTSDRNNFAPSVGAAWQFAGVDNGIGRLIFGSQEGDSVIRGGFGVAFQRPGMSDFTGVFGANQGIQVDAAARQHQHGTLPILLRNSPTLPAAPAVVVSDLADHHQQR